MALDRRYQVYVFNNGINNGLLKPIEQIAQIGQHQRSILFSQGETVYALIGNGVPNELGAASTIRIYKWRQSHFTKVSQHSIHWMSDIHLCQADVGMTVFVVVQTNWAEDVPVGSPDDTMTLLEVFVFVQERWRHVQNLHISSTRLYTFHMAGKCFLITAPVQRNGEREIFPDFIKSNVNYNRKLRRNHNGKIRLGNGRLSNGAPASGSGLQLFCVHQQRIGVNP